MDTVTFDILKFANTLRNAGVNVGVPDKQAKTMATAQVLSYAGRYKKRGAYES